jgi:hypothetical protein
VSQKVMRTRKAAHTPIDSGNMSPERTSAIVDLIGAWTNPSTSDEVSRYF